MIVIPLALSAVLLVLTALAYAASDETVCSPLYAVLAFLFGVGGIIAVFS